MAFYPDAWLDELRARCDLVDVVSEYVALTPKGRRYWGLCPFHNEKSPSFSVDADAQLYYCFGCHAGGTVFNFVMEMERAPFAEAVAQLAERVHMPLPEQKANMPPEQRARLLEALTAAARWYNARLYDKEGQQALEYLNRRGLDDAVIRRFGIGATGQGWESLTLHLKAEGFTDDELSQAGLIHASEGKRYDVFRNRVMFPIFDAQGRVIAFGGRILGDGQPKYLNSSDTPVFNKRYQLYGLNFLKKQRNLAELLLVEGYMDVVSLYQHGVKTAIATLGTAITADQARLMKRFAPSVTVCYDGDSAGQNATEKAIALLTDAGVSPKVLRLPEGKDPDDVIKEMGAEGFMKLERTDAVTWRLERAAGALDLSKQEDRTQFAIKAADILRGLTNPVEIEPHIDRLAVMTGFSREVLWQQVGRAVSTQKRVSARDEHSNGKNRHNKTDADEFIADNIKGERQLLALMAQGQVLPAGIVSRDDFTDSLNRTLAAAIESEGPKGAARVIESLETEEERGLAARILATEVNCPPDQLAAHIRQIAITMRIAAIDRELATTTQQLTQPGQSAAEQLSLAKRKVNLNAERLRLTGSRKE